MDALELKYNENTFDVKFTYKCFRLLAEKWNLDSLQDVLQEIERSSKGLENLSFDSLQKVSEMVEAGILAGDKPEQISQFDSDEFSDFVLRNINVLTSLFEYLGKCMPKQATPEKQPAAKPSKSKLTA